MRSCREGCIVVTKEGCDIGVAHAEEVVKQEDRALSGRQSPPHHRDVFDTCSSIFSRCFPMTRSLVRDSNHLMDRRWLLQHAKHEMGDIGA
jgi:hypothetical protein